jgi:hypothetical protein
MVLVSAVQLAQATLLELLLWADSTAVAQVKLLEELKVSTRLQQERAWSQPWEHAGRGTKSLLEEALAWSPAFSGRRAL